MICRYASVILNNPLFSTTRTNCIYTVYLLMIGYKYAWNMEVDWRNKLRINSAKSWFLSHRHNVIRRPEDHSMDRQQQKNWEICHTFIHVTNGLILKLPCVSTFRLKTYWKMVAEHSSPNGGFHTTQNTMAPLHLGINTMNIYRVTQISRHITLTVICNTGDQYQQHTLSGVISQRKSINQYAKRE